MSKPSWNNGFPTDSFEAPSFSVNDYVANLSGTAVEVAGPTIRGSLSGYASYPALDGIEPQAKLLVTDKYPQFSQHENLIDLEVSAEDLPFDDSSIAMLLFSYLPPTDFVGNALERFELKHAAMREGYRCLKPGGVLVANGLFEDLNDMKIASELGFSTLRLILDSDSGVIPTWNGLFIKTGSPLQS